MIFWKKKVPVDEVLNYKAQGLSEAEIINKLREKGYSLAQIRDALEKAEKMMPTIPPLPPKPEILKEKPPAPPVEVPKVPAPPKIEAPKAPKMEAPPAPAPKIEMERLIDELEGVIERIIEDKWKGEVEPKIAEVEKLKAKLEEKMDAYERRIKEQDERINDLLKKLVESGEEHKKLSEEIKTSLKAMEQMMGRIVPSMLEQIKELREITEKLGSLR